MQPFGFRRRDRGRGRAAEILKALSEIAYVDPAEMYEQRINPKTGVVIRVQRRVAVPRST